MSSKLISSEIKEVSEEFWRLSSRLLTKDKLNLIAAESMFG